MSADGQRRGRFLVGGALLAALLLVGVYLAAGGASYTPEKSQNPCKPRPWSNPESLSQVANQFSISAIDGAACKLGVSREALARSLASEAASERFARRHGFSEEEMTEALRAGLLRAVDDAEEAGALSPLLAGPLRTTAERVPLDKAILLIRDARAALTSIQSVIGSAGELLEQFLP